MELCEYGWEWIGDGGVSGWEASEREVSDEEVDYLYGGVCFDGDGGGEFLPSSLKLIRWLGLIRERRRW